MLLRGIPVKGKLQYSSLEEIKAWTSFSASDRVREGRSLEMFLRLKKEFLHRCLMVIKSHLRIKLNTQISDRGGKEDVLAVKGEMRYGECRPM